VFIVSELLSKERLQKLDHVIERHKNTKGCLMPILNGSQKIFGCIPFAVQKIISQATDIPMAEIYGVITFYSYFTMEPRGKYVISVCMGTACYVKNAQKILEELEKETGTKVGKTSSDGKFTIEATRCIGACGLAPVVIINKDIYARLTVDQVADIVAKY